MCSQALELEGVVADDDPAHPGSTSRVVGQHALASADGRVIAVSLVPSDPPACPEAVEAVREAEWVVLGPGSWFTSVIPHLLIPELRRAIVGNQGCRMVTLNLTAQQGETEGFGPETHLEVLGAHAPDLELDVVLADRGTVSDEPSLRRAAADLGAELVLADVAMADGTPRHDPKLLARAYSDVLGRGRIGPWR
jgi:uncharacterized cofD-like protein